MGTSELGLRQLRLRRQRWHAGLQSLGALGNVCGNRLLSLRTLQRLELHQRLHGFWLRRFRL